MNSRTFDNWSATLAAHDTIVVREWVYPIDRDNFMLDYDYALRIAARKANESTGGLET